MFDDVPGNICVDYHYGDAPKVAEAFAKAAHVTRLRLVSNRIVVCAMEPRSATATYDKATDRYTFQAGNQGAFGLKHQMAALLEHQARPDAHAHRQCRRLVRHEGLALSGVRRPVPRLQAARPAGEVDRRAQRQLPRRTSTAAITTSTPSWRSTRTARFLAVRLIGYANVGGYLANVGPLMGTMGVTRNLAAIYRTPLIEVATKVAFTHTSPIGAYRGAGRPEANYFMERLIATAAREMGIDQVEMRKRNHIKPEEMPFKTASGTTYDIGEFTTCSTRR